MTTIDMNEELERRIAVCASRLASIKAKLDSRAIARSPLGAVLSENAALWQSRHDDLVALRGLSGGLIAAGLASL